MKIYTYTSNNGNWDGIRTNYVVATSIEEVKETEEYKKYQNNHYDLTEPKEVNSNDILHEMGLYKYDNKINFTYEVKENLLKAKTVIYKLYHTIVEWVDNDMVDEEGYDDEYGRWVSHDEILGYFANQDAINKWIEDNKENDMIVVDGQVVCHNRDLMVSEIGVIG